MKTFYLCFECEGISIEAQIEGVLEMLLQHGLLVKSLIVCNEDGTKHQFTTPVNYTFISKAIGLLIMNRPV